MSQNWVKKKKKTLGGIHYSEPILGKYGAVLSTSRAVREMQVE